jgi:hypothetical protein
VAMLHNLLRSVGQFMQVAVEYVRELAAVTCMNVLAGHQCCTCTIGKCAM